MDKSTQYRILERLRAGTLTPEQARGLLSAAKRADSAKRARASTTNGGAEPIAIVGMSGRYPGAEDTSAYWRLLAEGRCAVREIPTSRWDVDAMARTDADGGHGVYCRWLGMLDDVECFDPIFFRIPPAEAEYIDPQHRLFLQEAYRAFEDANIAPGSLSGSRCGVYLGIMSNEYGLMMSRHGAGQGYAVANHFSIAAARIAYHLDLKGPAIPVDTACSSSLVCTHLACEALRSGEIDIGLVGGVTLYLAVDSYIGMCAAGMLSPEGLCKTFDQGADGFVPGEGVGALVLKRLRDAEADGDHILGLIVGSGINQDGRSNGITAPNAASQTALEKGVYARFGIDPNTIQYAEMHGTGTKLGDPVELGALAEAFRGYSDRRGFCAIGSVKSNLGHTSAAAGIASIQKVLLSFEHGQIPPTLHFHAPNEHFDFEASPFRINTALSPWHAGETGTRRACVSGFGFSGTNAHLVLEQYVPLQHAERADDDAAQILVWSARSCERLIDTVETHLRFIRETRPDLAAYADVLQGGRDAFGCRFAVIARTVDELVDALEIALVTDAVGQLHSDDRRSTPVPKAQMDDWIAQRDVEAIAHHWQTGGSVDWPRLRSHAPNKRLRAPTYRFARERHWFPDRIRAAASLDSGLQERSASPERCEYAHRLRGDESFLVDHRVYGRSVLPGVAHLALCLQAAGASGWFATEEASGVGSEDIVLEDIVWLQPCDVGREGLELLIRLERANGRCLIETADRTGRTYCRAIVATRGAPGAKIDLDAMRARHAGDAGHDGEACYRMLAEAGLEYGPTHRRLERLWSDGRQVLACLRNGVPAGDPLGGTLPGLLDASLQSVVGLMLAGVDAGAEPEARLPAGVRGFRRHADAREARWIAVGRSNENNDELDVSICDEDGGCVARFSGLRFSGDAIAAHGGTQETPVFVPVWRAEPVVRAAPNRAADVLILIGRDPASAEAVSARTSAAQTVVLSAGRAPLGEEYAAFACRLLAMLQTIALEKGDVRVRLVVARDDVCAPYAGLYGLMRTASLESPALRTALIEIAPDILHDPSRLATVLEHAPDGTGHYRLVATGWEARTFRREHPAASPSPWRDDAAYWIAGGAGALGLALAEHIFAVAPRARLLLTGRSARSRAIDERISAWHAQGFRVEYRGLDIVDAGMTRDIVEEYVRRNAPLCGVFQLAGVREDALLAGKSPESLTRVLAPKVAGTINIDAATRDQPLGFMVMFSSIAGVLGNVGQGDYAAANGFLHAFARQREAARQRGECSGSTRVFAWPLWDADGMRPDDDTLRALAARGIAPMPRASAWRILRNGLGAESVEWAALHGPGVGDDALSPTGEADSATASPIALDRDIVSAFLRREVSDAFSIPEEQLTDAADFGDYGIDSVTAVRLTRKLEEYFGPLSKTLLFEYRRLPELTDHFIQRHGEAFARLLHDRDAALPSAPREKAVASSEHADGSSGTATQVHPTQATSAKPYSTAVDPTTTDAAMASTEASAAMPIAIIGLSGRYPKARDLDTFWRNLAAGVDAITEIPPERWDHNRFFDSDRSVPGKTYCKWGGFIDGVDEFDPLFFNISPREAKVIDPQERLFLQTAYEALEDAGYCRATLGDERVHGAERSVGVYVGVMYEEYPFLGVEHSAQGRVMALSGSPASIANRVSYVLDLHGPSMAVDTMCSSSLTALQLACDSLREGRCRMAIAGGVNLSLHPNKFIALAQGRFGASNGRCMSFGEGGDGYVPSEGVGAVVLKPLHLAEADGDHIHGVIHAVAINHGGKTNAFTVPNPQAQAEVVERAYRSAGIDPADVSYIEAHGTGTALGDPIEIAGLTRAFSAFTDRRGDCAIGSVKSAIGHCESAAGISGLTKVLLQFRHGMLAPSLHAEIPNPDIDFTSTPFRVQRTLAPWQRPTRIDGDGRVMERPRIAGISSFGAGGGNAHVVVAEYRDRRPRSAAPAHAQAILLSARNEQALDAVVAQMRAYLDSDRADGVALDDLAFTLQEGREHWECRLVLVVETMLELRAALADAQRGVLRDRCRRGSCNATSVSRRGGGGAPTLVAAAAAWVAGQEIDWRHWRNGRQPFRIGAPTYPFARERHWVPPLGAPSIDASSIDRPAPTAGHPLLQDNISRRGALGFAALLRAEDPWLRDHRVSGRVTLAGAAQIEMTLAAWARLRPEPTPHGAVEIERVAWLRPVVFDRLANVRIEFREITQDSMDWILYAACDDAELVACTQGRIRDIAAQDRRRIDLAALRDRCAGSVFEAEGLYRAYASLGLEYGPRYRGLRTVTAGTGEALARIVCEADDPAVAMCLSPTVLDAAFQATAALANAGDATQPALPFALESLQVLGVAGISCWAHLRTTASRATAAMQSLDMDLYDDDGYCIASLRGLTSRRMRTVPEQVMEADAAGHTRDIALVPQWRIVDAIASNGAEQSLLAPDVVVGAFADQARWQRRYPGVRPMSPASIDAADAQAVLSNASRVVWIAPTATTDGSDPATACVLAALHWVRALLQAGAGRRTLECWFITSRAMRIAPEDVIDATAAGIHGFVGALAKEYPNWRIRAVDVDPGDDVDPGMLLRVKPDPSGEPIAFRHGQALARQLVPIAWPMPAESSFRENGVYLMIGGAGGIGEAFSAYLAGRYRARTVWLGRRPADGDIGAAIARVAAHGPAPLYLQADASDEQALLRACAEVVARCGAIHGIVHGALALADAAIARMRDADFLKAWSAKADIACNLATVSRTLPGLDFLLFFSSFNAFSKNPGQANYAAGCTYADALAEQLGSQADFRVRVINWGYWGSIGAVATREHRARMAQSGIGSIEPAAGMAMIEALLAGPYPQVAMLNASAPAFPPGLLDAVLMPVPSSAPVDAHWRCGEIAPVDIAGGEVAAALDRQLRCLLASQLRSLGWPADGISTVQACAALGVERHYARWLAASLDLLADDDEFAHRRPDGRIVPTIDTNPYEIAEAWRTCETGGSAQSVLVASTLRALPDILCGRLDPKEVLFPGGSMKRVEGIYRRTAVSDYFNLAVATVVRRFLEASAIPETTAPLRILEIGAGSGGTSAALLELIDGFPGRIAEYAYTDISAGFLAHGRSAFAEGRPHLVFRTLDIEAPVEAQGFGIGGYDLIVAANVLHATRSMQQTLANAKSLLKRGGLLILNELGDAVSPFTHLTFGLLDGWWRQEDAFLRAPGTPAMAEAQWRCLLETSGFVDIAFPTATMLGYGQQIVCARSDGLALRIDAAASDGSPPSAVIDTAATHSGLRQERRVRMGAVENASAVRWLQRLIGESLEIEPERIDPAQTLERYGIDSITVVQIAGRLREHFERIDNTLLFEHNTINALVAHLEASQPEALGIACGDGQPDARGSSAEATQQIAAAPEILRPAGERDGTMPIAVVGLSGRYPRSPDLDAFWDLLVSGESAIDRIPESRRRMFAQLEGHESPLANEWAGCIDDIDRFDPLFFRISMREAESMDPQERLFLEQAYRCVEDAGYSPSTFGADRRVGVYVGAMNADYPTGTRFWSIANRVTYVLDLHGPSLTIDTACSSSLTALHLAMQAMRSGEIDCALVGGVNLIVSPRHLQRLTAMNMLSPGGTLRAFGDGADGFVDGEGVGAMLLKPLDRAIEDGDDIYGLMLGSAINSNGRTHGYTVPSPVLQSVAIDEAYRRSGVSAGQVSYVEAHGTGTALGDPIEIRGLSRVFDQATTRRGFCALGSVKTQIGHTESAAGIAGITKVLLQLRHGRIAPTLNAGRINPQIDLANTAFRLPDQAQPWHVDGGPRIASVSSFGAGGANGVVVMSEHLGSISGHDASASASVVATIVPLSARDDESLRRVACRLREFLERERPPHDRMPQIAFTMQCGREAMGTRVAIVADSIDHLIALLRDVEAGMRVRDGLYRASGNARRPLDAMDEAMRCWRAGDRRGIAALWADNADIDWHAFYPDGHPSRMHLPGYPFAGQRYWLGRDETVASPGPVSDAVEEAFDADEELLDFDTDAPSLDWLFDHGTPPIKTDAGREGAEARTAVGTAPGTLGIDRLRELASHVTGVPAAQVDADLPFSDLGFDAADFHTLAEAINEYQYGNNRPPLSGSDCAAANTLRQLSGWLD